MQNSVFSIFINSCDSFEDCWLPFFKLFSKYWPDYKGKIYLNTEYKTFSYDGLNIVCTKVCEVKNVPKNKRATWSQCLKWALEQIDTDIVLYMQEDYFMKDDVKNDIIENFVSLMNENKEIDCIHLTDQAVIPDKIITNYENLNYVKVKQKYRVSCQAALWRKDVLDSYLRINENAWQFEEFGSIRAKNYKGNFLVVNNNWIKINEFEIIPYVFTGIVKGKWILEVVSLFEKNNIYLDYNIRGFYMNNITKNSLIVRLKNKILKIKFLISVYFEIVLFKIYDSKSKD